MHFISQYTALTSLVAVASQLAQCYLTKAMLVPESEFRGRSGSYL